MDEHREREHAERRADRDHRRQRLIAIEQHADRGDRAEHARTRSRGSRRSRRRTRPPSGRTGPSPCAPACSDIIAIRRNRAAPRPTTPATSRRRSCGARPSKYLLILGFLDIGTPEVWSTLSYTALHRGQTFVDVVSERAGRPDDDFASGETVDASDASVSPQAAGTPRVTGPKSDYGELLVVDPRTTRSRTSSRAAAWAGSCAHTIAGSVARSRSRSCSPGHDDARFEREARITARLAHPAIVAIHEAGRWPSGEPFFAMKLVAGTSLDKRIAETKTLRRAARAAAERDRGGRRARVRAQRARDPSRSQTGERARRQRTARPS